MNRKLIYALIMLLIPIVIFAGRSYYSGNTTYTVYVDATNATSYTDGDKTYYYSYKDFYFNTNNLASSGTDYNGYSRLFFTPTVFSGQTTNTEFDSTDVYVKMLRVYNGVGIESPDNDSLFIAANTTFTEDNEYSYRLDNYGPPYSTQNGVRVFFRHKTTASTDSAKFVIGVQFN